MKILIAVIAVVGAVGLILVLLRYAADSPSPSTPTRADISVTLEQIPAVVAKLEREGKDSSFAVFVFEPRSGEPVGEPVNLQYSIENGKLGLDWVLLSPRNIADKQAVSAFIARSGHTVTERELNGVKYLRVEGTELTKLGVRICRDFYGLAGNEEVELLADGFDWPS